MFDTTPGIELLLRDVPYRKDVSQIFQQLCNTGTASLLLESADTDSKDNLKSLLIVDSGLRITALANTVTITALSANGGVLLPLLDAALPAAVVNISSLDNRTLIFPECDDQTDEDPRLKSLSVFDALRLLPTLVTTPGDQREAIFLGGLFAYDLVASFENIQPLQSDQYCPDYCFYLAETLLVIDHQQQTAHLQASLFDNSVDGCQLLRERIDHLCALMHQPAPALTVKHAGGYDI